MTNWTALNSELSWLNCTADWMRMVCGVNVPYPYKIKALHIYTKMSLYENHGYVWMNGTFLSKLLVKVWPQYNL